MTRKKSRLSLGGLALLFCGTFALTGFFMVPGQNARAATQAFVRIIHASPFVSVADIFVDGDSTPFLQKVPFGAVSDYAELPPGTHKVQIALLGKGIGGAALTESLAIQPGSVYTVAAIGTSASNLSLEVFNDSNLAMAGTAKVRVYQLIPDSGWIDVQAAGKSVTGANYQQVSDYMTFSPGATSFNLVGSAGHSLSVSTTLKANTVTSLFAIGMFNGMPQAEVVSAETAALPGLPQTGSNPFAFLSDGQLSTPWLLIALAMVVVGGTFFTRRLFASH
jgi:hypothetical protein